MKRRLFLRGVGAAAAGVAIGLRGAGARAEDAVYQMFFDQARQRGRPLLLGTFDSADDQNDFRDAQETLRARADHEIALRMLLVEFASTQDAHTLGDVTNARIRTQPPSIAMLDGDRPRLVKVAKLKSADIATGLARFLRAAIPVDAAWLAPRAALLSRHDPELAQQVRDRIAAGQPTRALGRRAAPIVILEAFRLKGTARAQLLEGLFAPEPPPPVPKIRPESVEKLCGMAMMLLTPLGARFAAAYTNRSHGRGRNHTAT